MSFAYGCACGLLASLIWGGGAVVSRHLVTQDIAPLDLTALRYLGCCPIALAVIVWRGGGWLTADLSWSRIALLVALAGPPYHLLVIAGYAHATSGAVALLIAGLLPVFALSLACAMKPCAPRWAHLAGLGAIFVGLAVLTGPAAVATGSADLITPIGLTLFAAAALAWAVLNHLVRQWRVEPLRLMLVLAATSPLFLPAYLWLRPDPPLDIGLRDALLQIIYHGVLVGIVGTFVFLTAIAHAGARCAGNLQALSPAFAVGLGCYLLDEALPVTAVIAMIAIVGGIIAASQPLTQAISGRGTNRFTASSTLGAMRRHRAT